MIIIVSAFIKEWLKEIVVLFIIISLVDLLMPKGKMKKYVDFIMGIIIIFTVISPFTKLGNLSFNLDREVSKFTDNLVSESAPLDEQYMQVDRIYKDNISSEVRRVIEDNTAYKVKSCEIITKDDMENLLLIDQVFITLEGENSNSSKNKVKVDKIQVGKDIPVFKEDQGEYTDLKDLVASYLNIDTEKLIISKED